MTSLPPKPLHPDPLRLLFATPLIQQDLAAETDMLAALRDRVLARAAEDRGRQHSNQGGWQSDDRLLDWGGAPARQLFDHIDTLVRDYTMVSTDDGLQRLPLNWRINAWANINRPGDSNDLHCHPGAFWSGCFYVDDAGIAGQPERGGGLRFYDPRGPLPLQHAPLVKMAIKGCVSAGLGETIYPRSGLLLLFPAWLNHSVTAHNGTRDRISIAFNYAA